MKRRFMLLSFLCALPVRAVADEAAADEPGRLFFTPAQRAALDRARQTQPPSDANRVAGLPQTLRVDGVLRRSDGKTTVWINNREIADPARLGLAIEGDRVRVRLPGGKRSVTLKIGQSLNLATGEVREGYMPVASALSAASPPKEAMPASAAPHAGMDDGD